MAAQYFASNSSARLINYVRISLTSAADGTAAEVIVGINGTIMAVNTNPGAAAPTDNYDLTLIDEDGVDLFMGGGANRDTATSERFVPLATGSDGTTKMPVVAAGSLTLNVANAGNAKDVVCTIYYR